MRPALISGAPRVVAGCSAFSICAWKRFPAGRGRRPTSWIRAGLWTGCRKIPGRERIVGTMEWQFNEVQRPACSGFAAQRYKPAGCRVPRRAGTGNPPHCGGSRTASRRAEDGVGKEPRLLHCDKAAARVRSRTCAPDLPVAGVDAALVVNSDCAVAQADRCGAGSRPVSTMQRCVQTHRRRRTLTGYPRQS